MRGKAIAEDTDLARRAWRAMSELVQDQDRKVAVSEALGVSWARVLLLRWLAAEPHTLRAIAEWLAADPPYVTLMVDDLEKREAWCGASPIRRTGGQSSCS